MDEKERDAKIAARIIEKMQPVKGKPNTWENRRDARYIILNELLDVFLEDMWEELQKEL